MFINIWALERIELIFHRHLNPMFNARNIVKEGFLSIIELKIYALLPFVSQWRLK